MVSRNGLLFLVLKEVIVGSDRIYTVWNEW